MFPTSDRPTFFSLMFALADIMDLVSPRMTKLNRRTAFIAYRLGEEVGLVGDQMDDLLLASLLRDIGAFSTHDRLNLLNFDPVNPHDHAFNGSNLLSGFMPLAEVARIIRGHHVWWRSERDTEVGGRQIPLASHILHLADRIAILIDRERDVLGRAVHILDAVAGRMGTMFMPDLMPALLRAAQDEYFWMGAVNADFELNSAGRLNSDLKVEDLETLSCILARIVDFRSHYTAAHSAGVAAVGEVLARGLGFSSRNCRTMRVACHLHDLGKIAVPVEILEKPGSLTADEYRVVQLHPIHTQKLLEKVPDLNYGVTWAAQHHERIDGSGYPSRTKGVKIAFGSRVVAVADLFTAITEERPHRPPMTKEDSLGMLHGMASLGSLDREVLQAACQNYEELNHVRAQAQLESLMEYENMVGHVGSA
ncbi:MAG: HD domain-containing protein [bacterium]|nr:MAG: HD domain-containing protein [bacterium]